MKDDNRTREQLMADILDMYHQLTEENKAKAREYAKALYEAQEAEK